MVKKRNIEIYKREKEIEGKREKYRDRDRIVRLKNPSIHLSGQKCPTLHS